MERADPKAPALPLRPPVARKGQFIGAAVSRPVLAPPEALVAAARARRARDRRSALASVPARLRALPREPRPAAAGRAGPRRRARVTGEGPKGPAGRGGGVHHEGHQSLWPSCRASSSSASVTRPVGRPLAEREQVLHGLLHVRAAAIDPRHDAGDGTAVAGDDDRLAALDLIEQAEMCVFASEARTSRMSASPRLVRSTSLGPMLFILAGESRSLPAR
jgi:hypothetical protein